MNSVTVFSRRNDELQHSSYSTSRQSSNASTDIDLPGLVVDDSISVGPSEAPNSIPDAPFSIIIDSSWRKRFNPDTDPKFKQTIVFYWLNKS